LSLPGYILALTGLTLLFHLTVTIPANFILTWMLISGVWWHNSSDVIKNRSHTWKKTSTTTSL